MLRNLLRAMPFGRKLPDQLDYDGARAVLEKNNLASRAELAGRADAKPEMLYYLASDVSAKVRRKVAANPATPLQADALLCDDTDDPVRCELARKIARLVPGLEANAQDRLREQAVAILEKLADDHLPRVRQIVAEEISHSTAVPKHLALRLARDLEHIVRAPVLEFSPLLADEDLLEIIASGIINGAMEPIACRQHVSAPVADAIAATLDVSAVASLLNNKNAQIREETLDAIIGQAEDIQQWHKPIVMRPELSLRAVRRVTGFVASALLGILLERADLDLDQDVVRLLQKTIRERIKLEKNLTDPGNLALPVDARQAFESGQLGDAEITGAATARRREFVIHAMALNAGIAVASAERVMVSRSGKAITALAWKGGLAMRTALVIQREVGQVPKAEIVLARNGVDFPMDEDEMRWHLQFFGVEG